MLRFTPSLRLAALACLMLGSSLAQAQYSWIAPNGVRHFSDQPPPPGTPPGKILKAPGHAPERALPASAPTSAPAQPQAAPAQPQATLAQQEAAFLQRQKQRENEEKKEAQDAERRRAQAERCESARQVKAQVNGGARQVRYDAQGERVFLSDEEKAAKAAKADKVLAGCS